MNDFAFIFEDGDVSVDWSAKVSGIHNVKQKLINNTMTDLGTDRICPARGTTLMRTVTGGAVFDIRSAQHALNFAALAAKRTVRDNESPASSPADQVSDFTIAMDTVTDRKLITKLALTTADGNAIGTLQQII